MATGSLLALLDDIATILDDVALMTKVAAKKSAAMADDVSVMTKVAAQKTCLLYTSPSPRDVEESRMPSSA